MNTVESEKNFTSSLITALSTMKTPPTKEVVKEKARQLAILFDYQGTLDGVIDEVLVALDTRMGAGVSLVDIDADHDDDWVYKRPDIRWRYSDAYEKFLKSERWHPNVVQSLSDVGTKILGHLQDPTSDGAWDRRGLVIGHVQSGKTANYIALLAKAADAGYKFIVVIAGVHNNLRKQTQERIDEGFVGRSSDPANRMLIGVGLEAEYPHPATLTNIKDDFNKKTANQSGWQINDFSKPIVLVIKKHVSTLKSLYKWLKDMNVRGEGRIADVPMLMIDDEADNASINTNVADLDPTLTNALIRKILGLFAKSSYVGYTATPFANIFINPDAYAPEVYDELFPRDFIYCLDAPNTYFGPETVFLDEETSDKILEPITDCEEYLPICHKKNHDIQELPPSLYLAINQFIVARAIRNLRGHVNKHCSMMVNVSRFVHIQKSVNSFISLYEKKLRDAVKANYAMPDMVADKNIYMLSLKDAFNKDFPNCGFDWQEVKSKLYSVFESLRLFVVNSKSDEILDYKKYEKDGYGLTAIVVGGLSLSRGLTIEGLCVSYIYRNTRMYDTLMQMGRWFGYRTGYEDLCRVHLSSDSITWYGHIADVSEELRRQVKRMRRDGMSPKQFGLYVQAHPDRLLITAANKMRTGERVIVRQNFSGRLLESYILPSDKLINTANENLIAEFLKHGFEPKEVGPTGKGLALKNVPVDQIEKFLTLFKTHNDFVERKNDVINYLQTIADKYPYGDVLLISNNKDATGLPLVAQDRKSATAIEHGWRLSKDRVASRGDEKLGLTDPEKDQAKNNAKEDGKEPSDIHYRQIRNKPLLMIHILELGGINRVPAFGVSFPLGLYQTEIEVVANTVWINHMQGTSTGILEEEDDFDE